MRRKYDRSAVRYIVQLFDKDRSHAAQAVNHKAVVDDLMPDIDRRAVAIERDLDDLDRSIDAGAKAARGSDNDVKRGLGETHRRRCKRLLAASQGASYEHEPIC
jgi:hypothetical protein